MTDSTWDTSSGSPGVTASECYLDRLCKRSFLSLWSYPNLFRDQGRKNGKGDGKELSDHLVIFNEHVIIFSDKSCAFPNTGDVHLDWARWYRRSIEKNQQSKSQARNVGYYGILIAFSLTGTVANHFQFRLEITVVFTGSSSPLMRPNAVKHFLLTAAVVALCFLQTFEAVKNHFT